ncbi:MAG: DUF72 domain-containing protein [Candidatus Tectomicrobia bacterium]|uniref:DUF72 domain-containing protein n=1 Tax=Tectimicrobiota bacterium TaxID=2528274 RepID=A0A937W1F7_UNCTE|nr:DUF72 domain-containing protein [Candidatus Tectomicrobia bacterium]
MARRTLPPPQLDLFRAPTPPAPSAPVGTAVVPQAMTALAEHLPAQLYLGTSSWSFPGWEGLVYDRATTATTLARHGLVAYAQHPLLRAVGIDRTFYAPITTAAFAAYAADVPEAFRFVVKAHAWCTQPVLRETPQATVRRPTLNEAFLQPAYALEQVVEPCVTGLGTKLGVLLFQFSPLDVQAVGGPQHFAARLHAFFTALPRDLPYAVEVRNQPLLCPDYREALADLGVSHCYSLHPSMPPLAIQMQHIPLDATPTLLVRWSLNPTRRYAEAKDHYQPFDRIVDEDQHNRQTIASMCLTTLTAQRPTFVIANNKAEGSAPCTLFRLADAIGQSDVAPATL